VSETAETVTPEAAAPEPSASDDLRAAISAAWDEVTTEPEAPATEAAEPEAEAAERDDKGRFVGKDGATEDAPVEAQAEAPAAPAIPPELAPIRDVLDRHAPLYAARGIPAEQAVNALFEAQKMLETRPVESIQALARQYGVDLAQFAPQQAAQQPVGDPNYSALMAKVQQLEGAITAREQAAEQAASTQINQTIQQFAADPKHTHFPAVRTAMGALMQAGIANDLPTAYEMACRAHPQVFQAIQKAEQEARTKAEAATRSQAAAQAKAKAVSVRGSPAGNGFTKPPDSLRATIEAAFEGRLN
jgi:hypothetical protein